MTTPVVLAVALLIGADPPPAHEDQAPRRPALRVWVPAVEVPLFGASLSLFNRTVLKGDYAQTTPATIMRNFETGPRFDDDDIMVNFAGHPFHGALVFNFPRSIGIGFWGSFATTLFSDFAWEWAGEVQTPSVNDLVESSLGASMWGEAFHRLAMRMLSPEGPLRPLRAVGAFAIDPGGTMNVGVFGMAKENERLGSIPVRGRLIAGGMSIGDLGFAPKAMIGADVVAGLGHEGHESCVAPFDVFSVHADVGMPGKTALDAQVFGMVLGCGFGAQGPAGDWGLFGGTDFLTGPGFRFGDSYAGPGALMEWEGPLARLTLSGTLAVIAMGGAGAFWQTDYVNPSSLTGIPSRYSMGPGYVARLDAALTLAQLVTLEAQGATWNLAAQVPVKGWERVDQLVVSAELDLPASQLLGAEARWARRTPAQLTDVAQEGWTTRAFWGFRF